MPIDDEVFEAALALEGSYDAVWGPYKPKHWVSVREPVEGSPITEATDLPEDALEVPCGCLCGS